MRWPSASVAAGRGSSCVTNAGHWPAWFLRCALLRRSGRTCRACRKSKCKRVKEVPKLLHLFAKNVIKSLPKQSQVKLRGLGGKSGCLNGGRRWRWRAGISHPLSRISAAAPGTGPETSCNLAIIVGLRHFATHFCISGPASVGSSGDTCRLMANIIRRPARLGLL